MTSLLPSIEPNAARHVPASRWHDLAARCFSVSWRLGDSRPNASWQDMSRVCRLLAQEAA